MKWAEVIMLRSAGSKTKILNAALKNLMNEMLTEAEHQAIRVFHHEKLDTDICIVLFHNHKKVKAGGSILGLHLVAALEEVGLVNHTIWHEIHR